MRALLLIFMFSLSCWAQSNPPAPSRLAGGEQQKNKTAKSASETAKQERGSAQLPLVIETVPIPESEDAALHRQYEHHEKPSLDRWLTWGTVALAAFTLFLVAATITLAVFTYRLWRETRNLATDAKETSVRELRPYVGVKDIFFTNSQAGVTEGTIAFSRAMNILRINVKNFGQTPGYSMCVFIHRVKSAPTETIYKPFFPPFKEPLYEGQMIHPKQNHSVDIPEGIGFGMGDMGFVLYGLITYDDPLSNAAQRFEFCMEYLGGGKFTPRGPYNKETSSGPIN